MKTPDPVVKPELREARLAGMNFALQTVLDVLIGAPISEIDPGADPLFKDVLRRIKALREGRR